MKPNITIHNVETGEIIEREMTDDEYADLIASGWTEEPQDNGTPEQGTE